MCANKRKNLPFWYKWRWRCIQIWISCRLSLIFSNHRKSLKKCSSFLTFFRFFFLQYRNCSSATKKPNKQLLSPAIFFLQRNYFYSCCFKQKHFPLIKNNKCLFYNFKTQNNFHVNGRSVTTKKLFLLWFFFAVKKYLG